MIYYNITYYEILHYFTVGRFSSPLAESIGGVIEEKVKLAVEKRVQLFS